MKRVISLVLVVVLLCTMISDLFNSVSATASKITTAKELADRAKDIASNYKTLYVWGAFGAPLTQKNKERYINEYDYNYDRRTMINAASSDTFAFDCVGLIKGLLWGWDGTLSATYGGAKFASNSVPDKSADQMIKVCSDVSTDFSDIKVGELLWVEGHVGLYIGNGLAVECTPSWKNCVQITACNRAISGYKRRDWTKHGKLPYCSYDTTEDEDEALIQKTYPAYCKIKANAGTAAMSMPCSTATDSGSEYLQDISKGDTFTATALILNSVGNHWYKIKTDGGETAYVPSAKMDYVEDITTDVKLVDPVAPTSIVKGKTFSIGGTIKTSYNELTKVAAFVYKGDTPAGSAVTGGYDTSASGKKYSLKGSTVDSKVLFNELETGTYTYAVYAWYENYYAETEKTSASNTGKIRLYTATFKVTSSSSSCTHSYSSKVTKAATCTVNGVRTYTCSKCSASYTESIPATGHSYSSKVTAPTCTAQGYTTYTCSCGDSYKSNYTNATGHSYTGKVTAPTCTAQGYTTYTCSCGDSYKTNYTNAIGHSYTYRITKTPTIAVTGTLAVTCSNCGNKIVTLPKLNTTDYVYTTITPATCTTDGVGCYTWKTDEYENFSFGVIIPKTGHIFTTQVITPWCTEQGYTIYSCDCGYVYESDYTAPFGHSYKYRVTKTPTIAATGTLTGTCSNCAGTTTVTLPKLNATDYTYKVTKSATCETDGIARYTWKTTTYGNFYFDVTIAKVAHDLDDWEIFYPASCTEAGEERKYCNNCPYFEHRAIVAPGHEYEDGFCSNCGEADPNFKPEEPDYNGLVVVDGVWGYYEGGVLQTEYTGLAPYGDILFYVENGILTFKYTGLVWHNAAWRYVANSQLTEGYTGLVWFNDNWFYTVDSVIDWTFTGLVPYEGNYFYVQNNLLDWSYTSLGYHDGNWYFIQNGLLQKDYSGLVYFNDNWFYVEEGLLTYQFFGMVEYQGNLFYVQASHLDWNYTGLGFHEGAWYYFQNALYTPSFSGLVPFDGSLFYVKDGTIDWTYNGRTSYNGVEYEVKDGVVVL